MALSALRFADGERARLLDMLARTECVARATYLGLVVALGCLVPWIGASPVIAGVLTIVDWSVAQMLVKRARRPEVVFVGAWLVCQLLLAGGILWSSSSSAAMLTLLAVAIPGAAGSFPLRFVVTGTGITVALMVATASAAGLDGGFAAVSMPILVAIATAALGSALTLSDVEHREASVLDPLTGLLNRAALSRRAAELTEQSVVSGMPVAVIVGDIDQFKTFNDRFGHSVGDAVLVALADAMRGSLRAFDLLYRVGGEEFVVMMPGADTEQASIVAESLRATVAQAPLAGHAVTMSFGVAASPPGAEFAYEPVFAAADAALYVAKGAGRNCVEVSIQGDRAPSRPTMAVAG
ncbi:MAG TPA: GGDEF domain-containing protein [Solirubrobacteraceae bacterium]|nr:GGDEF domain-containing protein [Solirubrobacteraceae bacterium]